MEGRDKQRVLKPAPVIDEGITFQRLYDPADMCTVLISTKGFEESNMVASQVRLSGLKAAPEQWTLLGMANGDISDGDTADKKDFALVRLTTLEVATIIITLVHGVEWTSSHGNCAPRRLCVLLVEPKQGGEVLVEGLAIPEEGVGQLIRKLTLFFLGYEL